MWHTCPNAAAFSSFSCQAFSIFSEAEQIKQTFFKLKTHSI